MSSTAYAQIQLSYSTSDSGVTVTVTGIEKNPALVSVIKGEYNADLQADKREYVFFKELYENGSVFCKISDDDPSGEYTVITSIDGEIETESLWHMNTKLAADALKKLRECKSAEETAKVIEAEHGVLGIYYDEFKKNSDQISDRFYRLFSGTDKSADAFRSAYFSAVAITNAANGQGSAEAEQYVIRYSSELGLELDEYNALSAVARNEFLRLFASGIVNRTTPSEQTKEYMLLAKFNSEKSWSQCRDLIINDYKDFLSADVDKYNKSDNKEQIIKNLMNKTPYSSAAALSEDFSSEMRSSGNGGSSGGAGGGGGNKASGNSGGGYIGIGGGQNQNKTLFDDVSEKHWAYSYIKELYDRGIITGVGERSFCPQRGITRAEFATMIYNIYYKGNKAQNIAFADVSADDWYYNAVAVLYGNGILNGDGRGNINPNSRISRQDVCTILQRVMSIEDAEANFADRDEISAYAKGAVGGLCKIGVINGRGEGKFAPRDEMTRAETTAVLCRALERSRG